MTVWEAAVLGFVQGATEFLPVSSSGHLVIAQCLLSSCAAGSASALGTAMNGVLFEVAVHVATLLSILIVYRSRIADLLKGVLARDGDALTAGSIRALDERQGLCRTPPQSRGDLL